MPFISRHHGTACRIVRATVFLIVACVPTAGAADPARKQCIRECKQLKKDCTKAFKTQFKAQRVQCKAEDKASRTPCKRSAKSLFKNGKRECKAAFKDECKSCCKASGGSCSFTVCGDGTLVGEEECDVGDRVDGDGCSASCLLEGVPPGPLGTRIFSIGPDSVLNSRFVSDLGIPSGEIVLQAGEADVNGVAQVEAVGTPFFVATDIQQPDWNVRICTKVASCNGTIYCSGGANVDAVVELDSVRAGEECVRAGHCKGQPCCENACEGFADPVGSGNRPVITRVQDVDPSAPDSGAGALFLTCQQANRIIGLDGNPDCTQQEYGDRLEATIYTTGSMTARLLNHCAIAPGESGTAPDANLDITATGANFSCRGWATEGGPGVLANALPLEEPAPPSFLAGDSTISVLLND